MEKFTTDNIKDNILRIYNNVLLNIEETETLFYLPVDLIRSVMDNDDFNNYIRLRQKLIELLNLLEVFVYDTHEEQTKCFECDETIAKVIKKRLNGNEVETVNGEIEHWVTNGRIHHIFICDNCIKRKRGE